MGIFEMKPIAFNPENDLAPISFSNGVCRMAKQMKQLGLNWQLISVGSSEAVQVLAVVGGLI
jgi:hypothetical protein